MLFPEKVFKLIMKKYKLKSISDKLNFLYRERQYVKSEAFFCGCGSSFIERDIFVNECVHIFCWDCANKMDNCIRCGLKIDLHHLDQYNEIFLQTYKLNKTWVQK